MIRLFRDRSSIDPGFLNPGRQNNLIDLYTEAYNNRLSVKLVKDRVFASARWKNAKPQLEAETFGKCAFCEAPVSVAYYGDVEHFRPKATYWWIAYCYENFLFSCRICNGKKSDKHTFSGPQQLQAPVFPGPGLTSAQIHQIAEAATPEPTDTAAVLLFSQATALEEGDLPHPYETDPEALFAWEENDVLREVRIKARNAGNTSRAALTAAEKVVGLNRDELLSQRWLTYERLKQLKDMFDVAPAGIREQVADIMKDMTEAYQPFAGMVRYYVREQWNIP